MLKVCKSHLACACEWACAGGGEGFSDDNNYVAKLRFLKKSMITLPFRKPAENSEEMYQTYPKCNLRNVPHTE